MSAPFEAQPLAARLLEGKPVAERVLSEVAGRVALLRARRIVPGLATVLVGDDAASAGYVRKKHEACTQAGFRSENVQLPASTTQAELHACIQRLNADPGVHGFLVQHPLPAPLDLGRALLQMDPRKDADGLHPVGGAAGEVCTA